MFHIFIICSGLAALANLAVGYGLYGLVGFDGTFGFGLSVSCAFLAGMAVSFVLNRRYTFSVSGRSKHQELRDFFAVSLAGLLLTTGIAHYSVSSGIGSVLAQLSPIAIMPEAAAHICAIGITAFYSYLAHKYISFRKLDGKIRKKSTYQTSVYGHSNWHVPLEQAG